MTIRNQRFSLLKEPISSTLNQHLIDYPTPSNLSYWWGFGSLAGICLVIQIVTGVFLAMIQRLGKIARGKILFLTSIA